MRSFVEAGSWDFDQHHSNPRHTVLVNKVFTSELVRWPIVIIVINIDNALIIMMLLQRHWRGSHSDQCSSGVNL